jgi:SPP1 family phage portal protein
MEFEMLKDMIYSMTNTPDMSFTNLKGMTSVSGIAIKMMFMDAIFKARDKQEIFGTGLDRRLNILRAIAGLVDAGSRQSALDADISIMFNDVLPSDTASLVNALSVATGGEPIMSSETAVRMNPYVSNPEEEILKMQTAGTKTLAESVTE